MEPDFAPSVPVAGRRNSHEKERTFIHDQPLGPRLPPAGAAALCPAHHYNDAGGQPLYHRGRGADRPPGGGKCPSRRKCGLSRHQRHPGHGDHAGHRRLRRGGPQDGGWISGGGPEGLRLSGPGGGVHRPGGLPGGGPVRRAAGPAAGGQRSAAGRYGHLSAGAALLCTHGHAPAPL